MRQGIDLFLWINSAHVARERYREGVQPWELLLADLESHAQAERRCEERAEAEELRRAEEAHITLAERLRDMCGRSIEIDTGDGLHSMQVLDVGSDWVLGRTHHGQCLIPLGAVLGVRGLERAEKARGHVAQTRRMTAALRALADSSTAVRLVCEGAVYEGTLRRVGADYVDCHGARGVVTVPLVRLRRCEEARWPTF